jgi:hypothetical protein
MGMGNSGIGIGLILACIQNHFVETKPNLILRMRNPTCFLPAPPMFFKVDHNVRMDFAFMSLSFISASQLNSILLRKFSSEQMIFGALIVQSIIILF